MHHFMQLTPNQVTPNPKPLPYNKNILLINITQLLNI